MLVVDGGRSDASFRLATEQFYGVGILESTGDEDTFRKSEGLLLWMIAAPDFNA